MSELIYPDESYAIVGACFDVYNEKGCGFLEPIYHDCMELELGLRSIPFLHEPPLALTYKGVPLKHTYSPDFTCWNKIVLESKAWRSWRKNTWPRCSTTLTRLAISSGCS